MAYTAKEVAAMLGVSYGYVRQITDEGLLPCRRLGRLVRYTRDDVQLYLDAHRDAGYM
jgi:excisionase family DNA binding protein